MSRYNRTNFYPKKQYNDDTILDFTLGSIKDFKIKRPTTYYTVTYADLGRPDLLSYKLYDKTDYWYLIGEVNDIFDFFNDLKEGDVLQVPDVQDITDWYLDTKSI